jgi:glycerol-3-phosphate acyltransferase PlsX
MNEMILSIDLMGGDDKIFTPVEGIKLFLKEVDTSVKFLAFGTKEAEKYITEDIKPFVEFIESESYITSDDDPVLSMRRGQKSSMFMAIKAVSEGRANACVSSGNTGALMAISKFCFKTLEGIDRPAIATILPTQKDFTLLLDMGANAECEPKNLYQFAFMGQAFVASVCGISNPTVGILNIGTEEKKGNALVKNSFTLFQEKFSQDIFKGFIEGDKLMHGDCNVIVTDGFSGNIALKTMEGVGKMMAGTLKQMLASSMLGKIGYLIGKPVFTKFREKFDPNNYNGAMFLGLNGISIKSHGSANPKGFKNAIKVAYNLSRNNIISKIKQNINN